MPDSDAQYEVLPDADAASWRDLLDAAYARGVTPYSIDSVLDSAPRGFPRPLTGSTPTPWIAKIGDLGDIDVFRRAVAVMLRLCQVCGLELGATAHLFWRPGDVVVVDGAAVHGGRCAELSKRLCPALGRMIDTGQLREANVLTSALVILRTQQHTSEDGLPVAYKVPTAS